MHLLYASSVWYEWETSSAQEVSGPGKTILVICLRFHQHDVVLLRLLQLANVSPNKHKPSGRWLQERCMNVYYEGANGAADTGENASAHAKLKVYVSTAKVPHLDTPPTDSSAFKAQ
jgi:hypothetical protein